VPLLQNEQMLLVPVSQVAVNYSILPSPSRSI